MTVLERAPVTGDGHAVAARVRRLAAREMVALVNGEHEHRVRLVDAVAGEAVEEGTEGVVVCLELVDIPLRTGAICRMGIAGDAVEVMGIGDVGEGDRNAGLLHLGGVGEGRRGRHAVEPREPRVAEWILDRLPVQPGHVRVARVEERVDLLRAEQTLEP